MTDPAQSPARAQFQWRVLATRILNFPLITLVVAIAISVMAVNLAYWATAQVGPSNRMAGQTVLTVFSLILYWTLYKTVIAKIGWEPRDELALDSSMMGVVRGVAIGGALIALVVAIAAVLGAYRITGWSGFSSFPYDLMALAILPAFQEELFFRGILFRWLEQFGGSWLALAITSFLFGLAHLSNPNATVFSSFCIAMEAGLLLGGAYMLCRSLWLPMGLHAGWNFTQGFVFDVDVSGLPANGMVVAKLAGPDWLSGGAFGLEASVIALFVCTAAGIGFIVIAARQGKVVGPFWRAAWWRNRKGE